LYVRALAEGLFHEPPLDPARRERLRAWAAALTPARLAHWAARLDRRFQGGGRQRAGRAVEVALLTGRGLSWWQEHAGETGAMRPWYIQLTLPRDVLHRRVAQRVDEMLTGGLVDELRRILATGVAPHAPGLDGVGYREVAAMLAGRLPERDLREAIVVATRRYAKRQETRFRHQLRDAGSGKGETGNVGTHEVTQTEYPRFEQSSPYALALAVKQHEVAMRENLDPMHVHYAIPHAATAWLAKQMLKSQRDLKIVTTLHGTDITLVGQDPSYYTLTKFSIEQS